MSEKEILTTGKFTDLLQEAKESFNEGCFDKSQFFLNKAILLNAQENGKIEKSLAFNGKDDFIDFGNPTELKLVGSTTIEMWLKPDNLEKRQNPFYKKVGGEGAITIEIDGVLSYYYGLENEKGCYQSFSSGRTGLRVKSGQWQHIAIIRDLEKHQLTWYVNGELCNSGKAIYDESATSDFPIFLGKGYCSNFVGNISELRIWNLPRTQKEIISDLYRRLNGNEKGLVGYWPLNDNCEGYVKDVTKNNNKGEIFGPTWTDDCPIWFLDCLSTEAWSKLGEVLIEKGKSKDGIEACYRAIALNKEFTLSYKHIARSFLKQGQLEAAEDYCYQALLIEPLDGEGLGIMAGIRVEQNLTSEAEKFCRRALEINPNLSEAHFYLAKILAKEERFLEAMDNANKALAEKPFSYEIKNFQKDLSHNALKHSFENVEVSKVVNKIVNILKFFEIKTIIIWGYKTPLHTHHFIHLGFYRAFNFLKKYLDIGVLWFDDEDKDVKQSYFIKALVLTMNNVPRIEKNMPRVSSAYYLIHRSSQLYTHLYQRLVGSRQCIFFDEFRYHPYEWNGNSKLVINQLIHSQGKDAVVNAAEAFEEISNEPFHYQSSKYSSMIITWATDILPYEIDANKLIISQLLETRKSKNNAVFVGSIWSSNYTNIVKLIESCKKHNLKFEQYGSLVCGEFVNLKIKDIVTDRTSKSVRENVELVQQAFLAPAIQGQTQLTRGNYIPCRIYKNISYGALGVTNNPEVWKMFDRKIVFDSDFDLLVEKAIDKTKKSSQLEIFEVMDYVKNNHTYLNRISTLLNFLYCLN